MFEVLLARPPSRGPGVFSDFRRRRVLTGKDFLGVPSGRHCLHVVLTFRSGRSWGFPFEDRYRFHPGHGQRQPLNIEYVYKTTDFHFVRYTTISFNSIFIIAIVFDNRTTDVRCRWCHTLLRRTPARTLIANDVGNFLASRLADLRC